MNPRHVDLLLAAAVLGAAALHFASFAPWDRPVLLDAATWDSMAVEVPRGLVPYRDVFLHKTPGSALIGALGAAAGEALGLEPVQAAHGLFLVLGALAPLLLLAIARSARLAPGAAVCAAVALMAFDQWTVAALEGCRPKVPTVVFGLASLLAAERGRALSASFLGGLSVLCWQPGLAFLAGSWATLWLKRDREKPPGLAACAAGCLVAAAVPALVLLAWLGAHGALGDFVEQAVLFNVHYIEHKARSPLGTLTALAGSLSDWNDVEVLLAPAALAGLLLAATARGRAASARLPRSIVVSGMVYLAMTFVSFQSWPDTILLGPFVATLLGVGLCALLGLRLAAGPAAAMTLVILALACLPDDRPKFEPGIDFATQRERYLALDEGLSARDRVVGVSVPEYFLHTGRRNGWKWPYLWFGVDEFAAGQYPDGFEGMLGDLEADPPAMILVARLWGGPLRERFEAWAASRYDVRTVRVHPHYRHPLRVYRLRRPS